MLVLRRKACEAIILNGTITIYVLAVEGERVKLGIDAPAEVVIVRSELLDNGGASSAVHPVGPHPYQGGGENGYAAAENNHAANGAAPHPESPPYGGRFSTRRRTYMSDGPAPESAQPPSDDPLRYR